MPAIERARTRAQIAPRDITRVGVSIGPGGFTSLRVSIATAMVLAEALGAELVGVPSALVVARRVRRDERPFAVALASKGDTAFLVAFDPDGRQIREGRLAHADHLAELGVARLIADRFLPEPFRSHAEAAGIAIEPPTFDLAACLELADTLTPSEPASLRPIYPREPEAVTLWKQRNPT